MRLNIIKDTIFDSHLALQLRLVLFPVNIKLGLI